VLVRVVRHADPALDRLAARLLCSYETVSISDDMSKGSFSVGVSLCEISPSLFLSSEWLL